jgi:phospholipase C
MAFDQIQHVFVLMLENRSFDHLLGFSGISGTDAATGLATTVNGLSGTQRHTWPV